MNVASRLRKKTSGIDCPARTISETDLHAAVVMAVNQLIERKDELLPAVKKRLECSTGQNEKSGQDKRMAELDASLETLQCELLKRANAKGSIYELLDEIDAVREDKQKLLLENAANTSTLQLLDEFEAFFKEHPAGVTEYDESLVRKLIEKITLYDNHMRFEFKSGLQTDVIA